MLKEQYRHGLRQQDELLEELVSARHTMAVRVRDNLAATTEPKTKEIMIGADETSPTERQSQKAESKASSYNDLQP